MKNSISFTAMGAVVIGLGVAALLLVTPPVEAKKPFTAVERQDQQDALLRVVAKGDAIWHNGSLGTNGLACANCHPDASASNPNTFPKFQTNLGKVGTFREMINWCIMVPLEGKALAFDSEDMIALETYATYMHRGIPIELGKDEQFGAVPVKSGPGYLAPMAPAP